MQGRLKAINLISSQEQWRLDLSEILAPGAPSGHDHPQSQPDPGPGDLGDHGQHRAPPQPGRAARGSTRQPQATPHRGHMSAPCTTSRPTGDSAPPPPRHKRPPLSGPEPTESNDDDDFMPPKKQHAPKYAVNYTRLTPACCAPSIFNKFSPQLTMAQRKKISDMGFGGLFQISAEGLDNRSLLVFLMDKLNPDSMILEVGNQGGLQINPLAVNKVLGIPIGDENTPSSTEEENTRALIEFRKLVHVDKNMDVKCKHLLDLISKCALPNDFAIRIFFVVTFNKLLFPGSDNNIRGQDAFMTKDLSRFRDINWCKAVIFYLDNLHSHSSIAHNDTPRVKFFHQYVLEKIIREDRMKDKAGNETYGILPLRNMASTCYQLTQPAHNGIPAVADPISHPLFPSVQEELGGLVSQLASTSTSNEASDGMKLFDAKARHAIRSIHIGSQILVDAHKEFIQTL